MIVKTINLTDGTEIVYTNVSAIVLATQSNVVLVNNGEFVKVDTKKYLIQIGDEL